MAINFNKLEKEIKERGEVIHLDNGATLIFEHVPNFGLSWGRHLILAGSAHETRKNSGAMHFLEHMVFGDSKNHPDEIERMLKQNFLGMDINASTGHYMTNFPIAGNNDSNYLLNTNFLNCFKLVSDSLFYPNLSKETFERERKIVEREIMLSEGKKNSDPYWDITKKINKKLYSANPITFIDTLGDLKSLESLTLETLKKYHSKFYVGENLVFGAVGDFKDKKIKTKIISDLEKIPKGEKAKKIKFNEQPAYDDFCKYDLVTGNAKDSIVDIYFKVPSDESVEGTYVPYLCRILGGGMNSLLFQELRFKNKLVYSVGANSFQRAKTNIIRLHYEISPDKLEESLDSVNSAITKLKQGDFDDSLVEACKASYLPQTMFALQIPGWIHTELYERNKRERFGDETTGLDKVKLSLNITKKDVVDFANKYLTTSSRFVINHN
ncbi:MAG: pitrilysin family protein [Candidatus Nanoarchaeia archaeon]|nr:pitrilysin family protein [Candidatus Nanoarchaeia archaeon]